ncbi:ras GEF [Gigaspora margarita]|uniref:Ras GEF n=1 Tax=Gigaspora margarita TaxID=4874 RepID=A0A8H4ETG0_GIGMA|nr:ras GEF [Gigaspora margarita]
MAWRNVKKLGNLIINDSRSSSKIVNSQNTTASSHNSLTNNDNHNDNHNHNDNDNHMVSSSNVQTVYSCGTRSNLTDIYTELRDASELLYLQLPEDVKLVLDRLRNLQRAEISVLFYDKLPNGECQCPFVTLESALMSILILAPTLLLVNAPDSSQSNDDEDDHVGYYDAEDYLSSRPSSSIIQEEALSVIHENVECHYAGRSDQPPHSRYYARLSHSSISTLHSELSETSSKHSSLVKVLSASSLLTKTIGSILSYHNDILMNSFTDSTTLENFCLLCARVSKEAQELAKQIKRLTTQGKTDVLVEYGQTVYNELVSHANNLVEALDLFVNFVHLHLPQIYEEPSELNSTSLVNAQSKEPLERRYKRKKNTFKKKIMRSLGTFRRRLDAKQSINGLNVTADSSDRLSGNSSILSEGGHKSNVGFSVSLWRSRNESNDSDLSTASAPTVPIMYTKERKITFSESSLHKSRFHNHISPQSNNRFHRKNIDLSIDTSSRNSLFHFDFFPNTPNILNSNHRNHDSYLHFNNEPVSPALSNSSKGSKFKEMLDESPSKMSLGYNIDQNTKRHRIRTQSFISRLMSLSSSPPLSPTSTKSSLSIGNRHKSKENLTDSERENTPRPRRISNSSIKSYFLKHIHLPSRKGKVSENTARTTSYWPVTEDPLVSESSTNKSSNLFFRAPSISDKRPKLHKISSDTDLRSLRKIWAERDQTPPLSAHVEDVGEEAAEIETNPFPPVETHERNLRENLLRKIVTKKSSTSLSVKKKSSLSNMLKLTNILSRIYDHGSTDTESDQANDKTSNNSLKLSNINDSQSDGTLITKVVDGSTHIIAGTLEKLLSKLVDENEQDSEFVDCFILSHVFFIRSKDFLENMITKFKDNKLNENELKFTQHKVLNILYRWVTLQPENFQIDPKLHCQLQSFLTEEVKNVGFQEDIDRILSNCNLNLQKTATSIQNPSGNSEKAFQKSPKSTPLMRDSSPLLEFEAKNIAKYLTLMDFNALKSITFFDFITVWWRKRQAFESQGSPNAALKDQQFGLIESQLDAFTRRTNMLSHWIAHEICSLKTVEARKALLRKFIDTAKYCREFNNFHTSMFIALTLNSKPVRRLEQTWESLSNQDIENLQSIEDLIDSSGNMRNYRMSLENAKCPIVPFFASFLKDLTIIMQGAPTFLPNNNFRGKKSRNISATTTPTIEYNQESRELQGITSSSSISSSSTFSEEQFTKSELINFEKLRSLIKNVYNIKRYTSKSYPFENQLSRLPTINNTTVSLTNPPSLSTQSITKTNNTSTPLNILCNNIASPAKSSLDYIGEIIEKRLYEAAGAIFGGNVALMAMSDGGELEADLMALSLEAEPIVTSPQ